MELQRLLLLQVLWRLLQLRMRILLCKFYYLKASWGLDWADMVGVISTKRFRTYLRR
jgi:hypothetical protein